MTKNKKTNLNRCWWCKKTIQVMCFRGTGYCSEKCRKLLGKIVIQKITTKQRQERIDNA